MLATAPAIADATQIAKGFAAELGVMSVSPKDVDKLNRGFPRQLQGAGSLGEALRVGKQSVTLLDALEKVKPAKYPGYSSILDTTDAGDTISTSTRLGQSWLNGERSGIHGFNLGYNSRPMSTSLGDKGVNASDSQTAFFQQIAFNTEAVSNNWSANSYGLVPFEKWARGSNNTPGLMSTYTGESITTAGLDAGYSITRSRNASIGYYHQDGGLASVDASDVQPKGDHIVFRKLLWTFFYIWCTESPICSLG